MAVLPLFCKSRLRRNSVGVAATAERHREA